MLLTATPIQNSLAELWGLVQYVDPTGTLLGTKPVFEDVFCAGGDGRGVAAEQARELRRRLGTVIQRTLRRQAQEFLDKPFVGRRAQLFEYRMSAAERTLYDDVTDYLLRPRLHAFQGRSRQLLLGFHRRMASSTAALAASLDRVASRLRARLAGDSDPETATAFTGTSRTIRQEVATASDDTASPAVFRRIQSDLPATLAALDRELKQVLTTWLDAAGISLGRGGTRRPPGVPTSAPRRAFRPARPAA